MATIDLPKLGLPIPQVNIFCPPPFIYLACKDWCNFRTKTILCIKKKSSLNNIKLKVFLIYRMEWDPEIYGTHSRSRGWQACGNFSLGPPTPNPVFLPPHIFCSHGKIKFKKIGSGTCIVGVLAWCHFYWIAILEFDEAIKRKQTLFFTLFTGVGTGLLWLPCPWTVPLNRALPTPHWDEPWEYVPHWALKV